jgi:hypothetical protein
VVARGLFRDVHDIGDLGVAAAVEITQ